MKNPLLLLSLILVPFFFQAHLIPKSGGPESVDKIKGFSIVASPEKIDGKWTDSFMNNNPNWVTLLPFGFSYPNKPMVHYNMAGQWWGETPEGLRTMTNYAKREGLKVMYKPQIWIPGSWPGAFEMKTESDWQEWEKQYENFIMQIAAIAEETDVNMICIGTELKLAVIKREAFWVSLIEKIRKIYCGQLTYAANWDNYYRIGFWDKLDYIGVDAYFPLSDQKTPNLKTLESAWKKPLEQLEFIHHKFKKPILFTEYGYKSIDKTAWRQWEFENTPSTEKVNLKAQQIAYQAIFEAVWEKPWFHGGFIWQWFDDDENSGGNNHSGYTPQNKPVEALIRKRYAN